jgi:hypothetical protein
MCPVADPVQRIERRTGRKPVSLVLCSRIMGRDRWRVDALKDRPRLAAAVELVLRTEEGITEVRANPLTGRLLVCYTPNLLAEPVETLVHRAFSFGPMSREEFSLHRSTQAGPFKPGPVVAAELSCSVFQMIALGGICPMGIAAAALFFLFRGFGLERRCQHPA